MDLGDAYCESLRRTAIGPFRVEDAGDSFLSTTLCRSSPRFASTPATPPSAPPTASPSPGEADDIVRLTDADGLIALAEPREPGLLKPIVGFRG